MVHGNVQVINERPERSLNLLSLFHPCVRRFVRKGKDSYVFSSGMEANHVILCFTRFFGPLSNWRFLDVIRNCTLMAGKLIGLQYYLHLIVSLLHMSRQIILHYYYKYYELLKFYETTTDEDTKQCE